MSTELDRELGRLYAGLAHETQYTPLASPESLRRRGDRQTRTRATFALAAAAVVVAGVVAGGGMLLADDGGTKLQPAPAPSPTVTSSPTVTPSPSSTPSSTPSTSSSETSSASRTLAAKPAPTVVPKTVFLTAEELNSSEELSKSTEPYMPPLCGVTWGGDTTLRTSSVQGGYLRREAADPTEVPDAVFRQAVVVHRSAGDAQDTMAAMREAVTNCPTEKATAGRGGTYRNALVANAPVTGEDWLVIRHSEPAYDFATGELIDGSYDYYTASVRHGDTIVTFHTAPYENWGIEDPARFYELVGIGSERVREWRGPVGRG
jgi:hypothetical protein